jgi:Secretion system C-terminal sorting domain
MKNSCFLRQVCLTTALFLSFLNGFYAQNPSAGMGFSCHRVPTTNQQQSGVGQTFAPNGKAFTPKGTLRALVVFAAFEGLSSNQNVGWVDNNWAGQLQQMPSYVTFQNGVTRTSPFLFNETSDFTNSQIMGNVENQRSVSNSLNMMSKPNEDFRFISSVFSDPSGTPRLVTIDPAGATSWDIMNQRVFQRMMQINGNTAYYNQFNQRGASPNYLTNNATSTPDSTIDYIIFIYRYSDGWPVQPVAGMQSWPGSGGGFDGVGEYIHPNRVRYNTGFTMCAGGGLNKTLFLHELYHSLFDCPHYGGANGVSGNYFIRPATGLGTMAESDTRPTHPIMNAWERWYLGYNTPTEVTQNGGTFTIGDFVNQGQSIRVPIPNSNNQYLWIEYHAKLHPLDEHPWVGQSVGPNNVTVPSSPTGVYMFVENISNSRNNVNIVASGANGIKLLNARGNFDFNPTNATNVTNNWGHNYLQFNPTQSNPLSGSSPWLYNRRDADGNGAINNDTDWNSTFGNEGLRIARELVNGQDVYPYGWFGSHNPNLGLRTPTFQASDEVGVWTNPVITNYPTFNQATNNFNATFLNGLYVRVVSITNNQATIEVKFNETTIKQDVRWTGNIVLPNITGNTSTDMTLAANKTLTLNTTGTANRTTQLNGTFFNPTNFEIAAGAGMTLLSNSKLLLQQSTKFKVNANSELRLMGGAEVSIESNSEMNIQSQGRLAVEANATVYVRNTGHLILEGNSFNDLLGANSQIIVQSGGKLTINAANVNNNLQNLTSKIVIQNGGQLFINGGSFQPTGQGHLRLEQGHVTTYTGNLLLRGVNNTHEFLVLGTSAQLNVTTGTFTMERGIVKAETPLPNSSVDLIRIAPTVTPVNLTDITFNGPGVTSSNITFLLLDQVANHDATITRCTFNIVGNAIRISSPASAAFGTWGNVNMTLNNTRLNGCNFIASRGYQLFFNNSYVDDGTLFITNTYWLKLENTVLNGSGGTNGTQRAGIGIRGEGLIHCYLVDNSLITGYSSGVSNIQGINANVYMDGNTTIQNCDWGVRINGGFLGQDPYGMVYTGSGCRLIDNTIGVEGQDILFSIYARQQANVFKHNGNTNNRFFKSIFVNRQDTELWFHGNHWNPTLPAALSSVMTGFWEFWKNSSSWSGTFNVTPISTTGNTGLDLRGGNDDPMEKDIIVRVNGVDRNLKVQRNAAEAKLKGKKLKDALDLFEPIALINDATRETASEPAKHVIDMARIFVFKKSNQVSTRSNDGGWLPESRVRPVVKTDGDRLAIFPSPTSDQFQVVLDNGIYTLTVHDALGRMVENREIQGSTDVVTKIWENGIYIVKVINQTTKTTQQNKIVIQH